MCLRNLFQGGRGAKNPVPHVLGDGVRHISLLGLTGTVFLLVHETAMAMGFVPGMISSAFDAAPAATPDLIQQMAAGHWWTPLTAGLYPGLLLFKVVQDPVFLVALALVLVSARRIRIRSALI